MHVFVCVYACPSIYFIFFGEETTSNFSCTINGRLSTHYCKPFFCFSNVLHILNFIQLVTQLIFLSNYFPQFVSLGYTVELQNDFILIVYHCIRFVGILRLIIKFLRLYSVYRIFYLHANQNFSFFFYLLVCISVSSFPYLSGHYTSREAFVGLAEVYLDLNHAEAGPLLIYFKSM